MGHWSWELLASFFDEEFEEDQRFLRLFLKLVYGTNSFRNFTELQAKLGHMNKYWKRKIPRRAEQRCCIITNMAGEECDRT